MPWTRVMPSRISQTFVAHAKHLIIRVNAHGARHAHVWATRAQTRAFIGPPRIEALLPLAHAWRVGIGSGGVVVQVNLVARLDELLTPHLATGRE